MKKRVIITVAIIAFLLIGLFCLNCLLQPKTYSTAKKECERFLRRNYEELEAVALDLISDGEGACGYYKGYYCSYVPEWDAVLLELGGQGMLGGQYWDLIYTRDGIFLGQTEEDFWEEPDGNNISKAERLDEHWWYLWSDYDGTNRSYE